MPGVFALLETGVLYHNSTLALSGGKFVVLLQNLYKSNFSFSKKLYLIEKYINSFFEKNQQKLVTS
jgi:hypothetical protein